MATKTLGSGGDYTNFADWVSYLGTLGTLTATEYGTILNGEFNGGTCNLTGFTPTSTYRLIIDAETKFSGNPLRYTDGSRILFDGSSEALSIGVDHVTVQNLAISATGSSSVPISCGELKDGIALKNIIAESSVSSSRVVTILSQNNTVENVYAIGKNNRSSHYDHLFGLGTYAITGSVYKNCAAVMLATSSSTNAGFGGASGALFHNCVSYNCAVDYAATPSASGTNNATSKASGSSNCPTGGTPQYEVVAGDFESVSNGTHDLRVASGSTKLKNLGGANGTTLDILGNAVSGGTRDIGPFEYQEAATGHPTTKRFGGIPHSVNNMGRVGGMRRY